jgi:lysyl-tRNA synthetase class 2
VADAFEERRQKLASLREQGVDPYPARFEKRIEIAALLPQVDATPPVAARVAGRVGARRDFGQLVFFDLVDQSGRLQVMVKKGTSDEASHKLVKKLVDEGDFLGVAGKLGRSKSGEPTLFADEVRLLTKALRSPPEKWHGLTDVELRYRYRYLDLISNEEVRHAFVLRSRIIQELRNLLAEKGFLEVETPLLHPIAGGAAARPFVTQHNALDMRLFLRIAPELYLKRLLVGGFEKVFEIGRVFRNEGISPRHNPEFTMMELYWAYADFKSVMDLTEELIVKLARAHLKEGRTKLGEREIDLSGPFARRSYHELVGAHAGLDPHDEAALRKKADALGLKEVHGAAAHKVLEALFEHCVEPALVQPTFVTLYPTAISPLSKRCAESPELVERFELFVNGWELANAFSELNDPIDQRQRFEAQVASKDPEAPGEVDEDYLRALEHGMPPAGGLGIGIDRLCMVLGGFLSIRDTILFPLRRPLPPDAPEPPPPESSPSEPPPTAAR